MSWQPSHKILFVCLEFFVPLENFSLIWKRHHCRWRAANFTYARHSWPLMFMMAVYDGHLRGPVTLSPIAERLVVKLSLPVFTTWVYSDRGSHPDLPHTRQTLYLYATAAVSRVDWCKRHTNIPLLYSI